MACTSYSMASRTRTVTVPLCWALLRPQLKFWDQFWTPHLNKDTEVQWRRAVELGKGLEHKYDEEQLRQLAGAWPGVKEASPRLDNKTGSNEAVSDPSLARVPEPQQL